MSWDAYVSNNLMCVVDKEGNTLTSAALVGLDTTPDTSPVWAQSAQFPAITAEEVEVIKGYFADPSSNKGSFTIGGTKFLSLGSDDPETKLRGKCQGGGIAVSKTNKALVIGIWHEPVVASACNKIVEELAAYLVSTDF